MAELRRANGVDAATPRLHKQHSLRSDRLLLHSLHAAADHGCNLSSGGNSAASTTSSSTATATTALGLAASSIGGHAPRLNSSVEFDEHDIYYVSPSKRKAGVAPCGPALRPATAYETGQQNIINNNGNHNVVTFSDYVSCSASAAASHRGSLKRSKGRSNQSLCSCDAGDEAQLQPDAARPLYEYSLERRRKTHTYTCEQNAQILMRLERERNRKLSLTSVGGGGGAGELQVSANKAYVYVIGIMSSIQECDPPTQFQARRGASSSQGTRHVPRMSSWRNVCLALLQANLIGKQFAARSCGNKALTDVVACGTWQLKFATCHHEVSMQVRAIKVVLKTPPQSSQELIKQRQGWYRERRN